MDDNASPMKERLSVKEQIALKRAEVKKSQMRANLNTANDEDAFGPTITVGSSAREKKEEDVVEMGRWSIRETVERARNTGELLTL